MSAPRIYKLTDAGRAVSAGQDLSVPADYRRILGVIGTEAHFDVIRGALRRFPDTLLREWLTELEEIGYVVSVEAMTDLDLDFTKLLSQPAAPVTVTAEDAKRIEEDANAAEAILERSGAWIAEDRLFNRQPAVKPPAETTVLIVEDDPDQLALADLRVTLAGYKVRAAHDAKELLEDFRTKPLPDVLLLDIMLTVGNGFDILANIRKHPALALLPVAMLTAKDDPKEVAKGLALGADAYITKPYSKTILADTIGRVLKMM